MNEAEIKQTLSQTAAFLPSTSQSQSRRRVDLSVRDNWKRTPLFYAAKKGYREMALLLIQTGALLNAVDVDGNTVGLHFLPSIQLAHALV